MCRSSCLIMTKLFYRYFFSFPNVLPRCIDLNNRQHGVTNCTTANFIINLIVNSTSLYFYTYWVLRMEDVTVPMFQSQMGKASCPSGLQPQWELGSSSVFIYIYSSASPHFPLCSHNKEESN